MRDLANLLLVCCIYLASCAYGYRPLPPIQVPTVSDGGAAVSPSRDPRATEVVPSPGEAAARVAFDLTKCATVAGVGPLSAYLGTVINSDPNWKPAVLGALSSSLGPGIACALEMIATAIPQDTAPVGPPADTRPPSVPNRLHDLASRCPEGTCSDAKGRAAWLLFEASKKVRHNLPPSGEG